MAEGKVMVLFRPYFFGFLAPKPAPVQFAEGAASFSMAGIATGDRAVSASGSAAFSFAGSALATKTEKHLLGIITQANLLTGLKLALDAGDANSYSGSGQDWFDRSGLGNHFFRGATSGAEASDPTFNGSAGGLADTVYWSFDSGDFFTEANASMDLGDARADGARYTIMIVFYGKLNDANRGWFDDGDTVTVSCDANEKMRIAADEVFTTKTTTASYVTDDWNLYIASVDENGGAAGSFQYLNGAVDSTFNGTITGGPGAWTPGPYLIGDSAALSAQISGTRLGMFAYWHGVDLTSANADSLYALIKSKRFTTLP